MPTPTAPPEPTLYVLWFRPGRGRWTRVGQFGTRAEAMNAIGDSGSGDWRVKEVRPVVGTQTPGLFDDCDAEG